MLLTLHSNTHNGKHQLVHFTNDIVPLPSELGPGDSCSSVTFPQTFHIFMGFTNNRKAVCQVQVHHEGTDSL